MNSFNPYSVAFWLARRAELDPNRVAIDFEDRETTYADLELGAQAAAAKLQSLGVDKGDRVAVLSENRPEFVTYLFACAKLGALIVPLSWRLTEVELAWQVEDSTPKAIVASSDYASLATTVFAGEVVDISQEQDGSFTEAQIDFEDPLMILYTSGTTGRPKGAVLTHGNFFWANLNMIMDADIPKDEVSVMFLPMFHIGGWNVNTLSVLLKGGKVVLEKAFEPNRILELIPKKSVTLIMGVPANYLFMSQQPSFEDADFSSIRMAVVGGAPMPEALLQTYADKGVAMVQGYGLTELAPNALLLPSEDASRKLGSAGRPYVFTDTRLMDDAGDLIDGSGKGEIVARGPVVMSGYWNRPDATAETIKDGWLHTGDVGELDEEGFFKVVDRVKDMIISGGENIYPAEVENVIYEHPSVGEVAVIGVPSEQWGEAVHAIVVPKEGASIDGPTVIEHCTAKLAKFKLPRTVEIRSEPLPRTPAGKVKKPELRKPYWTK